LLDENDFHVLTKNGSIDMWDMSSLLTGRDGIIVGPQRCRCAIADREKFEAFRVAEGPRFDITTSIHFPYGPTGAKCRLPHESSNGG
jgi:hypothetical protein